MGDPLFTGVGIAVALIALSPVLIDPWAEGRVSQWGPPIVILATISLVGALRFEIRSAAITALLALAAWHSARRIRQWGPSRPLVQSSVRLVVMFLLPMQFVGAYIVPRLDAPPGQELQWAALVSTGAIWLVVTVEVIYQVATRWNRLKPAARRV